MRLLLLFFWFCNFQTASLVICSISFKEDLSINAHLENLANEVAGKYFSTHRCVVVISEPGLLSSFKINTSVVHVKINSNEANCVEEIANILRITFKDNCDGYIIQLTNPSCAFEGWVEIYKYPSIARHEAKYFYLPVHPQLLTYSDELLSRRESDLTANLLIAEISENSSDWSAVIYTNNFYLHPTVPGRVPKLYMDEWHYKTGFKENTNLYPDKILDLKGKAFRIATGKYLPLASAEPLEGSEVRIGLYFCEKFNCTPEAVIDPLSIWGTIYENLTTDGGVLGNVYNDKADVGILAVYLWVKESYYIDYTTSYLEADVTVMVPRPTKLSAVLLPFLPFHTDMWIAFFMCLILSTTSLYFITRASIRYTRFSELLIQKVQFTTIEDSTMRSIGLAVLQQPSSRLIGDSPNRYLFTSFEIVYLVLSAMYSAELASFLTIPLYHSPIDTFHEFGQSGINWYGDEVAWTFSLQGVEEEDAKAIVDHFRIFSFDELKIKIKEGKNGFVVERVPGGSITEQVHETADVIPMYHIMKEKLFGSPLVASIKKGVDILAAWNKKYELPVMNYYFLYTGSPYLKRYNEVIYKLVEHGHFIYWAGDVARKYLNSRIQSAFKEAKTVRIDSSPAVIQISNIQGVLLIYASGTIISIIAFFVEIIKYKNENILKENEQLVD